MPPNKGFFTGSQVRQQSPAKTLPQCGVCGLYKKCNSPKMPIAGRGGSGVLLVTEAPDEAEDTRGVQLAGKTGQQIRKILKRLRFDIDEGAWKTNAVVCHPPKNRKATSSEIVFCRPNLTRTIKSLNPAVIVPMGAAAIAGVLGTLWHGNLGGVERWVGWNIPSQDLNAWVCPTWHPSDAIASEEPIRSRQFRDHLATAIAHTHRPWPTGRPQWAAGVRRVTCPAKATQWLRNATGADCGAVAWDYETNMLKPDGPDAQIVSCAVAWGRKEPERCIAFPWHGEVIPAMGALLRSPIPKIASNLKFEDRWTRKAFGHRVRGWVWDTMLAAHVLENRPGITSVKFQSFVRLGVPVWNDHIEPFLKTKGDARVNAILREISINDLLLYNGLDALLEFRVATEQIKAMGYPLPWRIS